MSNSVLEQALARKLSRPDIYTRIAPASRHLPYGDNLAPQVLDVRETVPAISIRKIAKFLGVGRKVVFEILASQTPPEANYVWDEQANEQSCADELAALRAAFPGGRYTTDPRALEEDTGIVVAFRKPEAHDPHEPARYKVDQSHTVKRPITIATVPFNLAA